MKQKIFLILLAVLLLVTGYMSYSEFWANHTYYVDMFAQLDNRKLIIVGLLSGLIPVGYIALNKKVSLWPLLFSLFGGLFLFDRVQSAIKGDIV